MISNTVKAVLATALISCAFWTAASDYPVRPIKIVAPMAAGGGTDTVARVFAQKLSPKFGHSVIVENRPGAVRDPNLPGLPTFNEAAGIPGGYEITFWYGVFLPRNTPAPVVERARREFASVMKDPEILQRVKGLTLSVSTLTAEGFRDNIVAETAVWKKVIEDNNVVIKD